eukprot:TRINITY_DN78312_c0_g1_i1.p2 TRINITY_DN78312_c0_g1~~TRINITY_DN78312_c0_g1_i1.p2  ORF type:complete len:175 (+),score=61.95 TRINITY_DN78312_c0_g1_i1:91-615(+)
MAGPGDGNVTDEDAPVPPSGNKAGGQGAVLPGSAEDLLMQMVKQKQKQAPAGKASTPSAPPALTSTPASAGAIMLVDDSPEPERKGPTKTKASGTKATNKKQASSSSSSESSKQSSSSSEKKKKRKRSSNFTSLRSDHKHRKKAKKNRTKGAQAAIKIMEKLHLEDDGRFIFAP